MRGRKRVDLDAVRGSRARLKDLARRFPELRGPSGKANRTAWEESMEAMMATKKKTDTQDEQIVVRVSGELVVRVDAYAERLRVEQPGPAWRRSDVVRLLISRALDDVDPSRRKR